MVYQRSVCGVLAVAMCLSFASAYAVNPERDGAYPEKEHIAIGKDNVIYDRTNGWEALSRMTPLIAGAAIGGLITYYYVRDCEFCNNPCDVGKNLRKMVAAIGSEVGFIAASPVFIYLANNHYEEMARAEEIDVERGLDDIFPHSVRVIRYDQDGNIVLDKQAAELTCGEFDMLSLDARDCVRGALAGKKRSAVYYTYYWRPICITKRFDDYLFGDVR